MFSNALELMRASLEDIVEEIVQRLLNIVPSFMRLPVESHAMLRKVGRRACLVLLRQLEEGEVRVENIDWADLQDFELVDILRAFQVGSEIAWKWIKRCWDEAGYPPEEKLKAAEIVWETNFVAANIVAHAYMKQRQEAVKDFNGLLDRIRKTQDRKVLVQSLVEGACGVLAYRRAVFFIYEHEMLIPLAAMDRLDPTWGERVLEEKRQYPISPMSGSIEAQAFFGAAVKTAHAQAGERVAFIAPETGSKFVLVPVNPSGSPQGLLYIESDTRRPEIGERDLETLSLYADTVGLALENTRLYREVGAKRRVMDHLMSRVNTAHEEERARIARELHDSVAQSLLKIIYTAGFALDFLKEDPRLAVDEIEEVQQRAKQCLRELREIMANLRPTSLDILGLRETLTRYAEQFEEEYAISTTVDLKGLESIPTSVELAIFRILQEELTNVRKHSRAESVKIRTEAQQGDLILIVEDDGIGFDPQALAAEQESGEHLGLLAMRERVELLGGELAIRSLPGMGTRITVRIPTIAGGGGR
ncbi:MAG: GAF domain-containing sensor histidine kinase [Actinomycetota bacterium]